MLFSFLPALGERYEGYFVSGKEGPVKDPYYMPQVRKALVQCEGSPVRSLRVRAFKEDS